MVTSSADFPPDVESAHESRAFLRDFLAGVGADDLVPIGTLLVDELVSNVVRHAQSPVHVELAWSEETLRLEVQDGSSILPAVAELADADGGYGLRIVEAFAQQWGIRSLPDGKAVWCTLTRPGSVS